MTQHGHTVSAGGLGLARSNLFQRVYACLACGAVLLPGAAAAAHRADDLASDHNREAAFGGDYAVEGESREAGSPRSDAVLERLGRTLEDRCRLRLMQCDCG